MLLLTWPLALVADRLLARRAEDPREDAPEHSGASGDRDLAPASRTSWLGTDVHSAERATVIAANAAEGPAVLSDRSCLNLRGEGACSPTMPWGNRE